MNFQLISGEFTSRDALDLIGQMIKVKIKYHENMIASSSNEEDMKYRESKIKRLQNELVELRNYLNSQTGNLKIDASITIQ